MDNCELCHEDIVTEKTEMPCCNNFFHTNCILEVIKNQLLQTSSVNCKCKCGHIMFPFTNIDNQQYLDELAHEEQTIQTPQFKEDIKVFEKKIKETNSKFRIYNKYLNEKYTLYKELVTPHVEIIKGFKKEFIDTIRVSQEHKDFKNKSTSISFLLNKLCTKYKMPRYRLIKGSGLPSSRDIYCRSYYTAKILLLKKLRIRI